MLGGLEPIIIFQFSKLAPKVGESLAKIPVIAKIPTVLEQPPIPIYFSQATTGIYIDSEDKNLDIETDTETQTDGSAPNVDQKGIAQTITVNLFAKKDSLGLTLLSAMMDQIFDKVTSKEYAITYLHGPITIFRGVLHSFSINQTSQNDLMQIKIELSKGAKQPTKAPEVPSVKPSTGLVPLG